MKINSKIALSVVLAGFLALGQGALFANAAEKEVKKDQAEVATQEKKEVAEAEKAAEAKAKEQKAKEKAAPEAAKKN